ncbi:unnamed protein product [Staurois parvus]|uniref:Uncharacterized protein n=1 Tax=Staurois parvus TaxID=386267 RepID=A0ABN9BMM0_9NEOB|nr:unnamed protein product [Staurois parvus]
MLSVRPCPLLTLGPWAVPEFPNDHSNPILRLSALTFVSRYSQGRTDNSWGPRAIGIMGPLCPCPNSKKPMKKPGAD